MQIEIFKTNVSDARQAQRLAGMIGELFRSYEVNFDLDDCDRILRVKSSERIIDSDQIIKLLKEQGYSVEVLCDEVFVTDGQDAKQIHRMRKRGIVDKLKF